jgi:3-oxoacyl-[acyl-carrier-protein] synthase I
MTSPHVIAFGVRAPVGFDAAGTAAAVRAGISRIRFHPYFVDPTGEPVRGAYDGAMDPGLQGAARLRVLGASALQQVFQQLPTPLRAPEGLRLFLALPEHRPGFDAKDERELIEYLGSTSPLPLRIQVTERGHAAGLHALGSACDGIARGEFDLCLVGGVDSYFHADTLEWLMELGQLTTAESRSGFIPGEGAAFALVASKAALSTLRASSLGSIRSVATAHEVSLIKSDDINLARGMTDAVAQAAKALRLPEEAVDATWCDLNGERYRTDEWAYMMLRLPHVFRQRPGKAMDYQTAVSSWGDMGAATGPLLMVLASRAWARGYGLGPRALLAAGSEGGLRAAVVLEEVS